MRTRHRLLAALAALLLTVGGLTGCDAYGDGGGDDGEDVDVEDDDGGY